jgi:hypothetical protein
MARMLSPLEGAAFDRRPEGGGRSLAETLDHIGRCLWWYCSRLSDELPEPGGECPEHGLARIQCLIPFAESWLLAVPADRRADVIVPSRFPTRDPAEAWTFRKVCRRQAEHMVEHLSGLRRRRHEWVDTNAVES